MTAQSTSLPYHQQPPNCFPVAPGPAIVANASRNPGSFDDSKTVGISFKSLPDEQLDLCFYVDVARSDNYGTLLNTHFCKKAVSLGPRSYWCRTAIRDELENLHTASASRRSSSSMKLYLSASKLAKVTGLRLYTRYASQKSSSAPARA